jgi:hypothetical protein
MAIEARPGEPGVRRRCWPLLFALALLVVGLTFVIIRAPGGRAGIIYPIDDTYIAFAMAKNVADNGTWGANPNEFAPAASSPLWIVLSAIFIKVLGLHEWIPLLMSVLCGLVLLWLVDRIGKREGWPDYGRALALALLVVVTPMVPLAALGMEHLLHACLMIWILDLIWRLPPIGQRLSKGHVASLLIAFALITATRFEGLFLAAAIAFILLFQRRWLLAFCLVVAAVFPVILHGAISVAHGWTWLPSSVRLKGNIPNTGSLVERVEAMVREVAHYYGRTSSILHVAAALAAPLVALAVAGERQAKRGLLLTAVFLLTFGQHLFFAKTGWFFRYEAYLMAAQVFIIGLIVVPLLPSRFAELWPALHRTQPGACVAVALVLAVPQLFRGAFAVWITSVAMKNIHDQQYQMSEFARRYYAGCVVAANDIGAICLRGSVRVVDLGGLATRKVFRARLDNTYGTEFLKKVSAEENVGIVMVYQDWFANTWALPSAWLKVGTLRIENNFICSRDTVSFYGTTPAAAAKLEANLREFATLVPKDVHIQTEDTSPNASQPQ